MNQISTQHAFRCDLSKGTCIVTLKEPLMHQDALADEFRVSVCRGSSAVDLSGKGVVGYLYCAATKQTLILEGTTQQHYASVVLTAPCYATPGYASLVIQLVEGDVRHTLLKANICIDRTSSDSYLDPNDVLPSLTDLLGQIETLRALNTEGRAAIDAFQTEADALLARTDKDAAAHLEQIQADTDALISRTEASVTAMAAKAEADTADLISRTEKITASMLVQAKSDTDQLISRTEESTSDLLAGAEESMTAVTRKVQSDTVALLNDTQRATSTALAQIRRDTAELITQTEEKTADTLSQLEADTDAFISRTAQATDAVVSDAQSAASDARFAAQELSAVSAPPVIPAATGEVITVTDSAERPLAGLTLYGKTTQAGTPAPDAPVDLMNVGSSGYVTVQTEEGGSVKALTPNGLPGIPVNSGGNYTDANGQQWMCDEIDFARGVYVQRCCMETLSPTYDTSYDRYKYALSHPANMSCGDGAGIMCLCDKLTYSRTAGSFTDDRGNGIRVSTTNNKLAVGRYSGYAIGDITIMYPVDTPIETPLSAEELAAFRAMKTRYPSTTVCNDAGAGMKLVYIADTKNYIDQKIAAIAAAMLNA